MSPVEGEERYFRGGRLLPDLLTASRPLIGVVVAGLLIGGAETAAAWAYLLGYATDVVDGWAARRAGVASDMGTRLDGWCDVAFHAAVGLGLLFRAAAVGAWAVLVAILLVFLVGQVLPRWIHVHTVLGKLVGGVNRIVLVTCFLALVPPGAGRVLLGVAALLLLGSTYLYEARVTLGEHRTGERSLR